MARNSGVCVSFLASERGLPSNGAPTSCRAICGAIELAPGLKYKVSIAVLPPVDHESTIWPKDTLDSVGFFGLRRGIGRSPSSRGRGIGLSSLFRQSAFQGCARPEALL